MAKNREILFLGFLVSFILILVLTPKATLSDLSSPEVNSTEVSFKTIVVEPPDPFSNVNWENENGKIKSMIENLNNTEITYNFPEWKVSFLRVPAVAAENLINALNNAGYKAREEMIFEPQLNEGVPDMGAPYSYTPIGQGTQTLTGAGVRIAVLDSGIELTHPDFAGKNILFQDFIGEKVRNQFTNDCDNRTTAYDNDGHGTHIASIAAGTGAGSSGLYKGVAPGADLIIAKVCGECTAGTSNSGLLFACPESAVVAGFNWALSNNANVVSMSFGKLDWNACTSTGYFDNAIADARNHNTVVVASAGNEGPYASTVGYPACIPDIIAVGATFKNDATTYTESASTNFPETSLFHVVTKKQRTDGSQFTTDYGEYRGSNGGFGGNTNREGFAGLFQGTVDNVVEGLSSVDLQVEGQWKQLRQPTLCFNELKTGWDPGDRNVKGDVFWETGSVSSGGLRYTNIQVAGYPNYQTGAECFFEKDYDTWYDSVVLGFSGWTRAWSSNFGLKNAVVLFSSAGPMSRGGVTVNKPDVVAPGVLICAANTTGIKISSNLGKSACGNFKFGNNIDAYVTRTGTSFATPFVAGEAALLRQANPNADFNTLRTAIINGVKKRSEYDSNYGYDKNREGNGTAWVPRAVHLATNCHANPTATISPSSQTGAQGQSLVYVINIRNNDVAICGISKFVITNSCPPGFTCSLSGSPVNINAGVTDSSARLAVTSPTSATPASYSFTVTAYNNEHPQYVRSTIGTYVVNVPPVITILSPQNITYNTNPALTFTLSEPTSWIGYSLDNLPNVTITGNTTLTGLTQGSHNVRVYANDTSGFMGASNKVFFSVDTIPPTITLINPKNITYITGTVPLEFSINEPTISIKYSLDNQPNVTITGNTSLTGLIDGPHNIIVYAKDFAGNEAKTSKVFFSIDKKPIITFVSPTTLNTFIGSNSSYINVTSNKALSSATLEWNGVNETMSGSGTNWFKGKTGLANGNYTFRVFGIDLEGNQNKTNLHWTYVLVLSCGTKLIGSPGATTSVSLNKDLLNCPGNGLEFAGNNISLNCNGHTISASIPAGNGAAGILAENRIGIEVKNCKIKNFGVGIELTNTSGSTIGYNIIESNENLQYEGIDLRYSNNNYINSNTIFSNNNNALYGIIVGVSNNNTIAFNSIRNQIQGGLQVVNSNFNSVQTNNISNSGGPGVFFIFSAFSVVKSNYTYIFNNYFNNPNAINADASENGPTYWNITRSSNLGPNIIGGKYWGGNFWSDYKGRDRNKDGIGDTKLPYNSNGNIVSGGDFLPLVYTK